jgi:hypothetical protein
MKKIYILLCITFLFHENKAQHTLTAAFNPVVGDVDSRINIDTSGIFLGTSGTSQIWNYTGLSTGFNGIGSSTFIPMSSVPNNSLCPSGTIAQQTGLSGYYPVYINTSSKIEYLGLAQTTASNCDFYSDPKTYYSLPFTYGSLSTDTYSSSTWTGTINTIADGTGVLQLPSGTYSNILKLTFSTFDTDGSTNVSIVENQYFSAISKFPLLVVNSYTLSSSSSTNITIGKGGHLKALVSTMIKESLNEKAFGVFPNPITNGELFLKSENGELVKKIEITNVLGQVVYNRPSDEVNETITKKIDVSALQKGIYFLNISNSKGTISKKIIIE